MYKSLAVETADSRHTMAVVFFDFFEIIIIFAN
jgi:hypothetical protein